MQAHERQIEDGQDYTIASRLLRADGSEVAVEITSITVQRDDLRHFRIITVLAQPDAARPVTVHVAGKIKLVDGDWMVPGQMALHRMPCLMKSAATALVRPMIAALLAP